MQAVQRGNELGSYLGIFKDRIEVNADQEIIERLMWGRRRAAGLTEEEEKEQEDIAEKPPDGVE